MQHIEFLANYNTDKRTEFEYAMSEFLRMGGVYWAITALDIMDASDRKSKEEVKEQRKNVKLKLKLHGTRILMSNKVVLFHIAFLILASCICERMLSL